MRTVNSGEQNIIRYTFFFNHLWVVQTETEKGKTRRVETLSLLDKQSLYKKAFIWESFIKSDFTKRQGDLILLLTERLFSSLVKIIPPLRVEKLISQVPFVVNTLLFYKCVCIPIWACTHTYTHTHPRAAFPRDHSLTEGYNFISNFFCNSCGTFPEVEMCSRMCRSGTGGDDGDQAISTWSYRRCYGHR